MVLRKFRQGWIELGGLPFHLWSKNHPRHLLKHWRIASEIDRRSLKLVHLSNIKMKVELKANVVLSTLLEVKDGVWSFTISV